MKDLIKDVDYFAMNYSIEEIGNFRTESLKEAKNANTENFINAFWDTVIAKKAKREEINRYKVNETMRILGRQFIPDTLTRCRIKDVMYAHSLSKDGGYTLACDLWNLGRMDGIRAERARRNRK